MSFNTIRENKILAKISESTVCTLILTGSLAQCDKDIGNDTCYAFFKIVFLSFVNIVARGNSTVYQQNLNFEITVVVFHLKAF